MYRKAVIFGIIFGIMLGIALDVMPRTPERLFKSQLNEFEGSFGSNMTPCVNNSLVDSILSSPLSLELRKALLEYSRIHTPYLRRITNSQYWERQNIFDDQDKHRWWIDHSEFGEQYDGDILAILDPKARFVFFPAHFTFNRFQQTIHPDNVTVFLHFCLPPTGDGYSV